MTAILNKSISYNKLITNINTILSKGLIEAQRVLEYQRLKTYWEIGRSIRMTVDQSNGRLQAGGRLYDAISADLKRDFGVDLKKDVIRRTLQFYTAYPKFPTKTKLTFTHYRSLMRVEDKRLRLQLEREANKTDIGCDELNLRIAALNKEDVVSCKRSVMLKFERGEPFVYPLRKVGAAGMHIDCGFKVTVKTGDNRLGIKVGVLRKGYYYAKVYKGVRGYALKAAHHLINKVYTYSARPVRVIDGDTIEALVDVGFGIFVRDTFRLKGINAPESNTHAGKSAKLFLNDHLMKESMIVIRTSKEGSFGRWLADVFALPGSTDPHHIAKKGEYVNQMLVDQGHAAIYTVDKKS